MAHAESRSSADHACEIFPGLLLPHTTRTNKHYTSQTACVIHARRYTHTKIEFLSRNGIRYDTCRQGIDYHKHSMCKAVRTVMSDLRLGHCDGNDVLRFREDSVWPNGFLLSRSPPRSTKTVTSGRPARIPIVVDRFQHEICPMGRVRLKDGRVCPGRTLVLRRRNVLAVLRITQTR